MSDEDIKKTGEELKAFADDMNAKFDTSAKKHARTMGRLRVFSSDRANFWRMPRWLWVPLVTLLVLLFIAALSSVGLRPA
nr:hypothetical protein [uncultured Albidiferax sp.]